LYEVDEDYDGLGGEISRLIFYDIGDFGEDFPRLSLDKIGAGVTGKGGRFYVYFYDGCT
jgi:hypothetical protein